MMSLKTSSRLAIIGAGPAGLTLACLLQMHGYAPTVFEKEVSALERPQGGSLDLHPASGLLAVQRAGLDEQFKAIARYQDQGLRILDRQGNLLLEDDDDARPEVDRIALRAMLLDSLAPDTIQWASTLKDASFRENGTHHLVFEDGRSEAFDLVVGADGAWSRVRPLLTDVRPIYSGQTYIELSIDDIDQRYPTLARLIGRGTMVAVFQEKGLVAQRNAHGHIRVYVTLRATVEEVHALGIDVAHPEQARSQLLTLFADWHPGLLEIIHVCNDAMAIRPLYMLPVGHRWQARSGVTLIGDAAHLMPPSAGQGVNQAMLDAVELTEAMMTAPTLDNALYAYEQRMFVRSERAAMLAVEGLNKILSKDAPASTLAYFKQFMPA